MCACPKLCTRRCRRQCWGSSRHLSSSLGHNIRDKAMQHNIWYIHGASNITQRCVQDEWHLNWQLQNWMESCVVTFWCPRLLRHMGSILVGIRCPRNCPALASPTSQTMLDEHAGLTPSTRGAAYLPCEKENVYALGSTPGRRGSQGNINHYVSGCICNEQVVENQVYKSATNIIVTSTRGAILHVCYKVRPGSSSSLESV